MLKSGVDVEATWEIRLKNRKMVGNSGNLWKNSVRIMYLVGINLPLFNFFNKLLKIVFLG